MLWNKYKRGILLCVFFATVAFQITRAQSFEIMPGTERIFIDAQWLKAFDADYKWTLFSRARATAEYDTNATNLFMGSYLNYTTSCGLGATLVGRVASSGSGLDVGMHYFKKGKKLMVYALPSIQLHNRLSYSWFSIMRYTPSLNEKIKVYTSLELFSNFNSTGHVTSVQRIRTGLEMEGYQFGLALNFMALGLNYRNTDTNPGVFLRKQF